MKESNFCSIVGNSLDWHHKISDVGGVMHGQLPFDMIAVHGGKPVYIEVKFLPECKAFNFGHLENHQVKNLLYIQENCPEAVCLVLIGVHVKRGDLRCYYYKDMRDLAKRKEEKRSITKKEFLSSTNYVPVKKGHLDFDKLLTEN